HIDAADLHGGAFSGVFAAVRASDLLGLVRGNQLLVGAGGELGGVFGERLRAALAAEEDLGTLVVDRVGFFGGLGSSDHAGDAIELYAFGSIGSNRQHRDGHHRNN